MQQPRARLERMVLGSRSRFSTLMEATGYELARILRKEFPDANLPSDQAIADLWQRAVRAAVAGTSNDGVAEEILEQHGPAIGTRRTWTLLTAAIAGVSVAGLASRWGVETTDRPAGAIVAGLVVAAGAGAVGVGGFGLLEGGAVQDAHDALRDFVRVLFARNVPGHQPQTPPGQLGGVALGPILVRELERIASARGSEPSAVRGPPGEVVYRWDGEERQAIDDAAERLGRALLKLKPDRAWKAPICVRDRVGALLKRLSVAERDALEAEVSAGEDVFHLLVCCAAVASQLDKALDLEAQPLAA